MTKLEELKDRVERLPSFVLTFGGVPVDGLPEAVVRDKVLDLVNYLIKQERAEAPPTFVDLATK